MKENIGTSKQVVIRKNEKNEKTSLKILTDVLVCANLKSDFILAL